MRQACLLASATMILFALGCGSGAAPTSASRQAASPAIAVAQIPASALFGASTVDFARCLQGAADAACLSGARVALHAAAGAAATVPGLPLNLVTTSSGSSVTLTWSAPASGDAVTSYAIEAGSATGLANLANFATGSTATSFSAGGVGNGTYYVRVRAQNASGTSAASNESVLVVGAAGCTTAPNAPSGLAITTSGSTVTLGWSASAGGCSPTSYLLQAGSSVGQSDLANSNVGNTTSYVATGVGSSTYYVRVRAANAFGQSAPSNEFTLVVGSPPPGNLTGRWVGVAPDGVIINDPSSCDSEQDVTLDLTQTGNTFSGTVTDRPRAFHPSTCTRPTEGGTNTLTGTVDAGAFSFTSPGERGRAITCSGTFTATRLTASCNGGVLTIAVNRQ